MSNYPPPSPPQMPYGGYPGSAPVPPAGPGPKQYGILQAIVLAPLLSGRLYRDVARNWRGIAAGLLLVVLALTTAAESIKIQMSVNKFVREDFAKLVADFPPITITDGVVSSPVKQPYKIVDPDNGKEFAILDTTGQITSLDGQQATFLLTENKLFIRDANKSKVEEHDLSQVGSFSIDKQKITNVVGAISKWAGVGVFVVVMVAAFCYRLLQALLYAAIGLGFASAFGARLSYQQLYRLAIVSVVPVLLLGTILTWLNADLPLLLGLLASFVIAMFYLAMAVRANASDDAPPAPYIPPPPPQQA